MVRWREHHYQNIKTFLTRFLYSNVTLDSIQQSLVSDLRIASYSYRATLNKIEKLKRCPIT
jgi:hypothetical protein